ncbi:PP2C family protein-serine/threonine phosphatase [Leptospira sp. GIMC2001]|uniref:PP2C family protein-serine/threonine phosphatase n=1 Tax=Leptospira sp. GIMC2001 TaxID=1513297 RepID=UPI00234B8CA2|nr:PP2C family protein-serine/threonine phosphatase [Leptospira sp. GIMC2001]WCL50265.1 PP2C family protein-serine/threonine phosphatase [Leptospira sp. GIMC2001]
MNHMNNFLEFYNFTKESLKIFFMKESSAEEYEKNFQIRLDRLFVHFLFFSQFFFYAAFFFYPQDLYILLGLNLFAITSLMGFLLFLARKTQYVATAISFVSFVMSFLLFLSVWQLVYYYKDLNFYYLNNYYMTLNLVIVLYSFRLRRFSSIICGLTLIILHLFSLLFMVVYLDKNVMLIAFLPDLTYLITTFLGTGIILARREDIREIFSLNREKQVINNELELAKKVQDSLFPNAVTIKGMKYEVFRQSHNFLGGDFYDFIQLREGNVGIFLTDIAGHGISSAMVASIIKVIVSTIPYRLKLSPGKLLGHLDVRLADDLDNYHASAIYMFIDFQASKITLCNAGHPYVMYCPAGGTFGEIKTGGSILGFNIRDPIGEEIEMQIKPGDRFFLYTDGLIESPTLSGEPLDELELLNILNRHNEERNIAVLKERLIKDIFQEFGLKKFTDDTMFLLFEITENY